MTGQTDYPGLDEALKAIASSQRREILRLLGEAGGPADDTSCCGPGEVCACKLAEALGLAASTISHHMTILREAGLVHGRRGGQWVYYSLDHLALHAVADAIESFAGAGSPFAGTGKG
ncbi:MAG: metalloregulator ArsR/SmtB family transcription factor [Anaerosomatales bacterium]|nr:metalloregulator ArsR/SmtB family transcription factor [Anaerosomatales bacterium]MDT8433931.1 metalloregulator ArsR/SmtB family transcription factor [Anaerosomatales bacterium]